tara:strand:+ start:165 stop:578 length:414 start_codon:yes stop_codon:yes gene_type:complete
MEITKEYQTFPHLLSNVGTIRFSPWLGRLQKWRSKLRMKIINRYNGDLDILLKCAMKNGSKTSVNLLIVNNSLNQYFKESKIRRKNDKYIILLILHQKSEQQGIFLPKWGVSYNIIKFLFGFDIKNDYFFSPILKDK